MIKRIAFVMDPIESINPKKDTTLGLIVAALTQHWEVFYLQDSDMAIRQGQLIAQCQRITEARLATHDFVSLATPKIEVLSDFECIFMRKDPPFDMAYIYSTMLLDVASRHGCLVVNDATSIRNCNEKLFATHFPAHTPELVVSSNMMFLREFVASQTTTILKPLDGMGGASIFKTHADDPNLSVILETLTNHGRNVIMAQAFIADISNGDKRVLMIDGEPVDYCLARIPKQGETRGNIAAGGTGRVQPLSATDREIAKNVGPVLKQLGILFAGLDIIGDKLTEINVTSPTCLREISHASGLPLAQQVITAIETKLG